MEQVDGGQPAEELEIGELAGVAVVGAADPRQQARQRVDRGGVAGLDRRAWRPASPASSCPVPTSPSNQSPRPSAMLSPSPRCTRAPSSRTARVCGSRAMSAIGGRSKLTPWYFGRQHRARRRGCAPGRCGARGSRTGARGRRRRRSSRSRRSRPAGTSGAAPATAGAQASASAASTSGGGSDPASPVERRWSVARDALERGVLVQEGELDRVDRPVAVLAHDQLRDPLELRAPPRRPRRRRSSCSSPRGR